MRNAPIAKSLTASIKALWKTMHRRRQKDTVVEPTGQTWDEYASTTGARKYPGPSSIAHSSRLKQSKQRDTAPELALRYALHARGLRYRVNLPVPGQRRRTIDVAFTRHRLAVFVDGCFWHGCPKHGTSPKANADWWKSKLDANKARDHHTNQILIDQGWRVIRAWEHQPPNELADQIAALLESS